MRFSYMMQFMFHSLESCNISLQKALENGGFFREKCYVNISFYSIFRIFRFPLGAARVGT